MELVGEVGIMKESMDRTVRKGVGGGPTLCGIQI
jgi:hypothetical protein